MSWLLPSRPSALAEPNFELVFIDTASSVAGAIASTNQIKAEGAQMVLGPIFADEARAIRPPLNTIPVVSFSTDSTVAAPGAYIMGVMPEDQAQHIAHYASSRGARNTLIIAANDAYGQLMLHTYALAARQLGQNIMGPIWLDANNSNLSTDLAALRANAAGQTIDAIFLPLPANRSAVALATARNFIGGVDPLILGTALWDETDIGATPALNNALYAGPSSAARTRFDQSYMKQFGVKPPRLAALAYDAVWFQSVAQLELLGCFNQRPLINGADTQLFGEIPECS